MGMACPNQCVANMLPFLQLCSTLCPGMVQKLIKAKFEAQCYINSVLIPRFPSSSSILYLSFSYPVFILQLYLLLVLMQKLIEEQRLFENETMRANMLKYIPDEELVKVCLILIRSSQQHRHQEKSLHFGARQLNSK